jgi:DNA-binding transcriptional MerR regulator
MTGTAPTPAKLASRSSDPAGAAAREPAVLCSIGEVLNQLRPEFPDITISKLRFLETEGLVAPLRTPAGYRKYTTGHVQRLRTILTAQRDRFLPLRVIRERLETLTPFAAPEVVIDAGLTREQVAERAGLDPERIDELESYGLLVRGPDGCFGVEAVTVAAIAARLAAYGLESRHLRPYRATADREVGLLAQLVPALSKQGGRDGRALARETVHELAALCAQLHGALVRQGLRSVLEG